MEEKLNKSPEKMEEEKIEPPHQEVPLMTTFMCCYSIENGV